MGTEHGRVALRMGERRDAERRAVADRAPEGRRGLDPRRMTRVRMKIDAEASAPCRGEARRQPERQLGRTVAADQEMGSAWRRDAEHAVAPALEQKAQIADRSRPRDGADDRQDGGIKFWTPGDRWRVDCGGVWIGRER